MNFEKLLQLAYDGALWRWLDAKENYEHNPNKLNKRALDVKWADMNAVTELCAEYKSDGKDAFCNAANYLERVRAKHEEQMKRFASAGKTGENDAKYKYMILVRPLDESVKPSTMFCNSLSSANRSFSEGTVRVQRGQIKANIFLYEKNDDGQWCQLKVTTAPQAKAPQEEQTSQEQQAPQEPSLGYAIHVVHNNGKVQNLDFEHPKAVEATVEMLKFYLKLEMIETVVVFKKITPAHYETIKIIRREDV